MGCPEAADGGVVVVDEPRPDNDSSRSRQKHAALLMSPDGHVAYPNRVPPSVHSPEESIIPKARLTGSSRTQTSPFAPTKMRTTEPPRRSASQSSQSRPLAKEDGMVRIGPMTSNSSEDGPGDNDRARKLGRNRTESFSGKLKKTKETLVDHEQRYRHFSVGNANYQTSGRVKRDGRLRITINETANTGYIAKVLGTVVRHSISMAKGLTKTASAESAPQKPQEPQETSLRTAPNMDPQPRLNIVIMVIGSRGDAQPFLRIGKVLKEDYGHRVRIATHPAFRDFVEKDSGLEFFSVGGDPSELMSFMVKNPGMIPSLEAVRAGEIGRRREAMAEMFEGFWRACINASDGEQQKCQDPKMVCAESQDDFVADAIIANPPSFAHIHCAEALGIPLHLVFTFPYTPTQDFPHPLASIKMSNKDPGYTNFISYPLVEMMVWQGLGDLVNSFRVRTLGLDPVSTIWAPGATYRLHVPFTYLWSPSLVPKPKDWGDEINVSGFVFLDLASAFQPPKDLEDFLDAGEPPIYIGFGSIVVDDPDGFTDMIFDAVEKAGVRALVSKGWGGFGGDHTPDNVFLLDNTPHDWLFPRVKACVIHGGAGTTAIALKCGLPTMIVPFFGDQHFWGSMVASAGAGPEPVPYKYLDADKLADGIKYCLTEAARQGAGTIAASIERDGDGAQNAVRAIHGHLKLQGPNSMRCSILRDRIAAWRLKDTHVRLSPLAADILVGSGMLCWSKLRLLRHTEWNDFEGPGEPVTGVASSLTGTAKGILRGIGGMPYRLGVTARKRIQVRRSNHRRNKEHKTDTGPKAEGTTTTTTTYGRDSEDSQDTVTDAPLTGPGPDKYLSDIATSVGQAAWAIAKAPAGLSLALAQGFHNAPRLYGDDTVRRPMRITGFHSGLVASRKELVHGVYDGVTGVVRLPLRGARASGMAGFVKGTGMGLGGLVLKSTSAIVGPVGFTLQGLVKQAERRRRRPQACVRRVRIAQGQRERRELGADGSLDDKVVAGWRIMRQLKREATNQQRRGLAGQFDRLRMDMGLMFDDVDVARECLAQLRAGKPLDEVVGACERRGE
ncbi:hypothetical protein G6O67_002203 [Ophiocordyceps sinensis]|uniref:UDP-glucose,sterol transferase n=1 Tax=Ophiocordyceps sinensis TaxID=72228 RepID=A0A8H4V7A4_9HYPO|nr:hypothetical protein G6O67_002203 [Ophiocordyceps sinensis]